MTVDTPTNQLPVTWIIGATGGIGAALARRLAPRTQLVLSARNEAPLTALASELGAQAITVDATQPESIQQALTSLLHTHGRIDAVVLAVGSILLKSAHRTALDEWHTVITQNLHAAFYVVRAVTDKMQRPITSNAAALEASRQMHPLGRIGMAEDVAHIAEAVLTSTWMTGQVVVVDGGLAGIKK